MSEGTPPDEKKHYWYIFVDNAGRLFSTAEPKQQNRCATPRLGEDFTNSLGP